MPHVVHLEVETVPEGFCVGVSVAIAGRHQHRRVNVAVGSLRRPDHCDDLVEAPVPLRIALDGLHRTDGFDELVEVAVVPRCAVIFPLGQSGGDAEMLEEGLVLRPFHDFPHGGNHLVAAGRVTLLPEAARPLHLGQADRFHLAIGSGRDSLCRGFDRGG
jgi:hypothetical protein